MDELPKLEWVKLIPADSIPVFCFGLDTTHLELDRVTYRLGVFFGDRKFLTIRGIDQIYAIADQPAPQDTQSPQCICGGEPHVSHCPACTDPFLRVIV